eukprot:6203671-Pleurochrysis_carterae.AAC.2
MLKGQGAALEMRLLAANAAFTASAVARQLELATSCRWQVSRDEQHASILALERVMDLANTVLDACGLQELPSHVLGEAIISKLDSTDK